MKYDLKEFEALVKEGYLRKSEKGDLVLYGYTDKTTFDRNWNQFTKVARGLILNATTGGSFYSDQCQVAQTMLKQYNMVTIPDHITLLAEIIYPENKIIVDYKGQKKLVLLGAFDRTTGEEVPPEQAEKYASLMFMEYAKKYDHTIEQMIALQKTLPKDDEGFVVRFNNGLRVKIKGEEYLRIAKIISQMSPISFWESMEEGVVKRDYLLQIPEEFRGEYEPIVKELEDQYVAVKSLVAASAVRLGFDKLKVEDPNWRRTVGIYLKQNEIPHSAAIFPFLLESKNALDKYILKAIRPDGNSMKVME